MAARGRWWCWCLGLCVAGMVVTFGPYVTSGTDACLPCTCTGLSVDCSNRSLHNVPRGLPCRATELDLSRNWLTELPPLCLKDLRWLLRLDLSHNRLSNLSCLAFQGLRSLQTLYLHGNKLALLSGDFPSEVFKPLSRLQRLYLHDNVIEGEDDESYPDEALSALTSLQELRLDGVKFVRLGQGFGQLVNLTSLAIGGKTCFSVWLPQTAFHHTPALQHLCLADCKLNRIHPDAFLPLTSLVSLDLSRNRLLTLRSAMAALCSLCGAPLSRLDLSKVEQDFAIGVVVREEDVRCLARLPLVWLWLESNRIQLMETPVPGMLPPTTHFLSLRDNSFTFGPYLFEVSKMTSVVTLDLRFQHLSHIPNILSPKPRPGDRKSTPTSADSGLRFRPFSADLDFPQPKIATDEAHVPSLPTTDVDTPKVATPKVGTPEVGTLGIGTPKVDIQEVGTPEVDTQDIGTSEVGTPEVGTTTVKTAEVGRPEVDLPEVSTPRVATPEVLLLPDCGFVPEKDQSEERSVEGGEGMEEWRKQLPIVLGDDGRVGMRGVIHLPPNTTYLDASVNTLNYDIYELSFTDNSLRVVNLSFNMYHSWYGPFHGLDRLEVLDASHNFCDKVGPRIFQGLASLRVLNVSDNFLGFSLEAVDGRLFSDLTSLQELVLNANRIRALPSRIFHGLVSLQRLDLSGNELTSWSANVSHLKELRELDLSNNFLRALPPELLSQLDALAPPGGSPLVVRIHSNALSCTCAFVAFWSWLLRHTSAVQVADIRNESCVDLQGAQVALLHYEDVVLGLEKQCANYLGLFSGVLVLVLTLLSLVAAVLVYRYRWKLRYLYYMARWRRHQRQREGEAEGEGGRTPSSTTSSCPTLTRTAALW